MSVALNLSTEAHVDPEATTRVLLVNWVIKALEGANRIFTYLSNLDLKMHTHIGRINEVHEQVGYSSNITYKHKGPIYGRKLGELGKTCSHCDYHAS